MSERDRAPGRLLPDDTPLTGDRFVAVAAVLGSSFYVDDVAAVLGESVARLMPLLADAVDTGLVHADGPLFAFRDAGAHDAIYMTIAEPLRRALHCQIGGLFAAQGGRTLEAAEHFRRGARSGDTTALAALEEAALQLAATDPRRAATYALSALELTTAGDADRPRRAATAVTALYSAGRITDAAHLARTVLAGATLPGPIEADLHLTLSSVDFMHGSPSTALEHAESVIGSPRMSGHDTAGAELARLRALLASDDLTRARQSAEEILAGAAGAGAEVALAGALSALAFIAWDAGRVSDALGLMSAAARRSEHEALVRRSLFPRLCLAPMLAAVGETNEAEQMIDAAQREIEMCSDAPWSALSAILGARLQLGSGKIDEALAAVNGTIEASDELGATFLASVAFATLAEIALLRGDIAGAGACVARCALLPEIPRVSLSSDTVTWVRARLASARGGPSAAVEAAANVYDNLPNNRTLLLSHPGAAAWLVREAIAAGDRRRAANVALAAGQLASDNAEFEAIAAVAAHARGVFDRDADALEWAADHSWSAWARGSAREDAARVRQANNEHHAARVLLDGALADYLEAGAGFDAARVRRQLKRASEPAAHSRQPRPVEGWESLTDSERRVASFVVEGLTNRQVAERAFLSRHTVDFHLRQAFRKLNVSSRVELTRIVLEHERASSA